MKSYLQSLFVALVAILLPANSWAADPDLDNDFTLVKSVAWGEGDDITRDTGNALSITAFETGNKKQQTLYAVTAPTDAVGWIGVQLTNSQDGKGWWNRSGQGLWSYNAQRSAAVYGDDLTTGWLVVFTCSDAANNVLTLTNGAGEPDGPFTYTASEDGKTYYCTITGESNAYVGFCGNRSKGYIKSIAVYKPNKAVVKTSYKVNYVDTEGNVLKEAATYDAIGGANITLGDADKANITIGDDTYVYDSDDTEGKTVAEDGSSVVTVKFHKAQNFSYKVNEMAGSTAVRTTEGNSYETATVKVGYRKYIESEGVLYSKDATNKEYNYSFTLTKDNQEENLAYTATDVTNVVFLSEGEHIEGLTACTSANTGIRSSNSSSAYATEDTKIVKLSAGTYKIHAIIYDASKSPNSNWIFKAGETEVANFNCTTVNIQEFDSNEFTLTEDTEIILAAGGNANMGLDAIYITGDGKVVEGSTETEKTWRDIKVDLTNGNLLEESEKVQWQAVGPMGIAVAEDGTVSRVEADAANAACTISGKWHSTNYGWSGLVVTVPVEGPVKITYGLGDFSGDVSVKDANGTEVGSFNIKGSTWNAANPDRVAFTYYKKEEPTTLTISGGGYQTYFAIEKIDASTIPSDIDITYSVGDSGAEGVAPDAEKAEIGKEYTLPKNFTLYKEGHTLTGWTNGTVTYAPGETITAGETNLELTPVFTENEANLADRTEPVTVKFDFQRQNGAPTKQWEGKDGLVWVAQATVNGKTIDVPTRFSTAPGKFANASWTDWCQLNNGTKFTIPSCKGAVVTIESYNATTTSTIDGQTDYEKTSDRTVQYTIANTADNIDVVIGDGAYFRYIQVVLPVVEKEGGKTYTDEPASIIWNFTDTNIGVADEVTPADAFSMTAVNTGDLEITGVASRTADDNAKGITFVKFKPSGSTQSVEWTLKPAAGLTFTPTKVSAWIQRFGTDAENGVTITAKKADGETITLGNFTAPRANQGVEKDKFAGNSNYTNKFEIELTAEQQAALASTEGFSVFATVGVGSSKEGGFGDIHIDGFVNGTMANVEKFTLSAVSSPEEGGSINVYPAAENYEAGSEVQLTATKNFGYKFVNWTDAEGNEVSTEAKFKYAVNANSQLTANFEKVNTYELALTVDGTNDYMVAVTPAPTVVDGKNMYEEGTAVQLTANQYEGLVTFTNWSDGETNSEKLVSMTENITLTAMYAQADIIAGWDFYKSGGSGRKADFYAQDNDADALNLVNTESGETSGWLDKSTIGGGGYESFKGAAVNWRTGSSNGDVGKWHWQTKVNAEAFTNINVQFQMLYNYNAYQTYNVEFSTDAENWTNVGSITMGGAKQPASFSGTLPEAANNQAELYIRMIADKTSSVDGSASANDGNTLAMFFITGTPKLVDDGVAPKLVSTVPENGATGASATGKIVLTFDERVKVKEGTQALLDDKIDGHKAFGLTPTVSGKTVTFEYKGLEYSTEYVFNLPAKSVADLTDNYLEEAITLAFTTMTRPTVTKSLYDFIVPDDGTINEAITAANNRSDKNVRFRIFVKKGTYVTDKGATVTVNGYEVPDIRTYVTANNISFIGEDRDATIITNDPNNETFAGTYGTTSKYDGIGNSDVLQTSGEGLYYQDITIKSGIGDALGRNLAVQDRGTKTIYKNTCLYGYQDTWTSNNDNGLYYFEGGQVRGRTDFLCGKGDAFFNGVEIRMLKGGYIAVPSKSIKYGYTFKDCTINGDEDGVDGNYTLGRPWGSGTPVALWIDTKMNVVPSAIGWNEMSGGWPKRFAEYNSMTSTGTVIDLSGRKKTFGDGHENNPALTAEEAYEAGNLHNMYGDWDPTLATEQAPQATEVELEGTTLKWSGSNYALLYAICANGSVVAFTTDSEFDVSTLSTSDGAQAKAPKSATTYAVRAANEMGGLGEAVEAVVKDPTGIREISESAEGDVLSTEYFNAAGAKVSAAQGGVIIKVQTLKDGRKVATKLVK